MYDESNAVQGTKPLHGVRLTLSLVAGEVRLASGQWTCKWRIMSDQKRRVYNTELCEMKSNRNRTAIAPNRFEIFGDI